MHRIFTDRELDEIQIVCPECGWKGKGTQTDREELNLTDATEVYCPECKTYLGFIDKGE